MSPVAFRDVCVCYCLHLGKCTTSLFLFRSSKCAEHKVKFEGYIFKDVAPRLTFSTDSIQLQYFPLRLDRMRLKRGQSLERFHKTNSQFC